MLLYIFKHILYAFSSMKSNIQSETPQSESTKQNFLLDTSSLKLLHVSMEVEKYVYCTFVKNAIIGFCDLIFCRAIILENSRKSQCSFRDSVH